MTTINGAPGNQTLVGTSDDDVISGFDGSDTINGGDGNDLIFGHSAADIDPVSGVIRASLVTTIPDGLVAMATAAGDPSHIYFLAKDTGVITAFDLNTGSQSTFIDIDNATFSSGGERGVLSLAFHPDYASNGRFFVNLTLPNGDIEIREYSRSTGDPLKADPATAHSILSVPHSEFANHNGGQLAFSPIDHDLYLGIGDGGSGDDPNSNGQNVNSLLAKIIRIDVNGDDFPADPTRNYAIPATNPFVNGNGADEIWAIGVRNPFRMSFDTNGDLYIGDVGQSAREEIDYQANGVAGRNYGWRIREGDIAHIAGSPPTEAPVLTDPVFAFDRDVGFTVTGGYVYHGPTPGLQGSYVFADFGSDRYFTLAMSGGVSQGVLELTDRIVWPNSSPGLTDSFGLDASGQMYVLSLTGQVHRLDFSAAAGDGSDVIDGGNGDDAIYGGAGNDALIGGAGNDFLFGGSGNDLVSGGDGNDLVNGGAGDDTLDGGAGIDTISYADASAGITIDLDTASQATGGSGQDSLAGFENAIGSAFADIIGGTGQDNVLTGGAR